MLFLTFKIFSVLGQASSNYSPPAVWAFNSQNSCSLNKLARASGSWQPKQLNSRSLRIPVLGQRGSSAATGSHKVIRTIFGAPQKLKLSPNNLWSVMASCPHKKPHHFSFMKSYYSSFTVHDMYLGITRPLTYPVRQNGKCMAKMILCVWLLSASITLPPLFGWAQNINDDKVCLISQDFGYTIYSTAVAFYIPMSVMLFMYYQIYKAAKKSAAKHKFSGFPRPEENEGIASTNGIVKLHKESEECTNFSRLLKHERKNISIFKREQKAATTLGIIVGAFTVCWLPFFILSTARPFICGTSCSCIPLWVERTFLWLGYANSLINPFIYAFFNRDLRTTYRNLLQCRYRNINRKLSAAGMHEALKLAEKPEYIVIYNPLGC
uniref:5-hydroxytryptamine receptor 7 n=1 Tax=Anolis carolinensis TaxID=28377 RepID=R4GCD5_ANOCA